MAKSLEDPLVGARDATCCCGLPRDPRTWVSWRSPGATHASSDRLPWQCVSTVLLLLEMSSYFYVVLGSPVLLLMGGIFCIKALVEIWGQTTPTWLCPGTLCMLFVVYVLLVPTFAYMFGYCTLAADIRFPGSDIVALLLYLGGSSYALYYEVHRFRWKAKPENKGKLHTVGPAAWCIHPNYFGDLFTYSGWALAAGTTCALSIPILMFWMFQMFVIPNSDNYLAERYSQDFPAYSAKTATLVPGLHSALLSQIIGWICLAASVYFWFATCPAQCAF